MDNDVKRKNILDLQFQKYLVLASTSIVIAFTYFIGAGIAIFAGQIPLNDFISMAAVFIISAGILGFCSILFFNALFHLKNIPRVLIDL